MGKGLPSPKPRHAGQGVGVPRRPVHGARLLLHHPPAATANGAIKVVVKGLKIRIALAHKAVLMRGRRGKPVGQKPQRIGIPSGNIQIGAHIKMIEIGDLAHVVMADRRRAMFAQNLDLQAVKAYDLIAGKAAMRHDMRGVCFGHGQVWQRNLVKAGIIHRPEHIAPSTVKRLRRLIFLRAPVTKGLRGRLRIRQHRVMAGIFVIGLPSRNMAVLAITFRHRGDDARAFSTIGAVAKAIVPARAKTARFAVTVQRDHIGMFGQHPTRRRRGRRAQHHLQPRSPQRFNRAVQPAPIIACLDRLHQPPGKFTDPHPSQPKCRHPRGIFGPLCFGPMFGVIADAKASFHNMT